MKAFILGLACALLVGCGEMARPTGQNAGTARRTTKPADSGDLEPDNTAVNVRDKNTVAKTPIDQEENKEDIRITADIRKRVVATKMSVNAQNAKIITQDGKVTLRGPVESEEERQAIEDFAVEVAGESNVTNELEVSTN